VSRLCGQRVRERCRRRPHSNAILGQPHPAAGHLQFIPEEPSDSCRASDWYHCRPLGHILVTNAMHLTKISPYSSCLLQDPQLYLRSANCARGRRNRPRSGPACLFWLAVLYIVVRLTLADSKAVLPAYYASLRLFSCSYFTYILRSAVAQPNLLARRSRPLMSGLPRRRRGRG
jgi:hypothetical protein